MKLDTGDKTLELLVRRAGSHVIVTQGEEQYELDLESMGDGLLCIIDNGVRQRCQYHRQGDHLYLQAFGQALAVRDVTHQPASGAAASGSGRIKATMDGAIIDVLVQAGQAVKQGDTLVILEAMKMETEINAPADGTVAGTDTFTVTPTGWSDLDGDPESYALQWTVNGNPSVTTDTIDGVSFDKGGACSERKQGGNPREISGLVVFDGSMDGNRQVDPQIAVEVILRIASRGLMSSGSGTLSTRTSCVPCHVSARIMRSPAVLLYAFRFCDARTWQSRRFPSTS